MFIFSFFLVFYKQPSCVFIIQRQRIAAVGDLTNCPPGTEAKFITKGRSLELQSNRIMSAESKAPKCTAGDCFKVMPQLHKT